MTDYANDPIPLPDSAPEPGAADAFAHGSLGRLSPAWWEPEGPAAPAPEPWLDAEAALDRFLGWTAARGIEPWPHQEEALMALMMGDHVVLGTPTGSGKSLVALGLCFMAMATGRRSYYTAVSYTHLRRIWFTTALFVHSEPDPVPLPARRGFRSKRLSSSRAVSARSLSSTPPPLPCTCLLYTSRCV